MKRFKVEVPTLEIPSRADVSIESPCGSPVSPSSATIDSLEDALLSISDPDFYNQVHLVEVDRHHTTWVMPNFTRIRPFTEDEHARLTAAVVFHDEEAWTSFTNDDILIFHSTWYLVIYYFVSSPLSIFSRCLCKINADFELLDDTSLRQNPLSRQLLESLTSATVGDIATLPTYALRAQLNFHRTEYLHNLHIAQVYSQRAQQSEQISESAYATLSSRMDTEEGPEDEMLNQMRANMPPSTSLSTLASTPIPIVFDLSAHSEEIVSVPGFTASAPASF